MKMSISNIEFIKNLVPMRIFQLHCGFIKGLETRFNIIYFRTILALSVESVNT